MKTISSKRSLLSLFWASLSTKDLDRKVLARHCIGPAAVLVQMRAVLLLTLVTFSLFGGNMAEPMAEGRRYCNTARWGTNKYCVNTVKYCEILCEYCEILQRYRREILQDTAQIQHKYCEQHTCFGWWKVQLLNINQGLRSKDYYTLFKNTNPKEEKSIRGQLDNSIWFDSKFLSPKSRCQLCVAIDWTKPIY